MITSSCVSGGGTAHGVGASCHSRKSLRRRLWGRKNVAGKKDVVVKEEVPEKKDSGNRQVVVNVARLAVIMLDGVDRRATTIREFDKFLSKRDKLKVAFDGARREVEVLSDCEKDLARHEIIKGSM
ncbi:hypothetical protein L1987_30057 [Smallanthus sonchifolius]|uniref:Uncharacterized protein n=1 Tax=Smallanthus sonchifolius TaxID=185202 RepID=A0ACB9I158_9ASTR|nr:hypothetical protein L1987_30057 [Smallanthus sonchifolius]